MERYMSNTFDNDSLFVSLDIVKVFCAIKRSCLLAQDKCILLTNKCHESYRICKNTFYKTYLCKNAGSFILP